MRSFTSCEVLEYQSYIFGGKRTSIVRACFTLLALQSYQDPLNSLVEELIFINYSQVLRLITWNNRQTLHDNEALNGDLISMPLHEA